MPVLQNAPSSTKPSQPKSGRTCFGVFRVAAVLALAALSLAPMRAFAQANPNPPTKLTYQGFLTDINGVPIGNTGPLNKNVIFRIYDAATGGNKLWTSQQTVTFDKGNFSVLLGEGSAYGTEAFNADLTSVFTAGNPSDRYLELTVDSAVISPRQQFLSSPYSLLARRAIELSAGSPVVAGSLSSSGAVSISGNNVLEFGAGVSGKEGNAGKIGYKTFSGDSLDIIGAGNDANSRKVSVYAEGGVTMNGPLKAASVQATSFTGYGTIPIGGIIMWSGAVSAIPDGWALCDGNTVNSQQTPDLRSRFIVGASSTGGPSGLTRYDRGNTGGEERHTLTIAEMPSHNHPYIDRYYAEYQRNYNKDNAYGSNKGADTDNDYYYINTSTDYTGGGGSHENRPPYYALAFIMRVK